MAQPWIKVRPALVDSLRVFTIAKELRVTGLEGRGLRLAVVGGLVLIWGKCWEADDPEFLEGYSLAHLDALTELPGFGTGMAKAGWAIEVDDGVEFPRATEWMPHKSASGHKKRRRAQARARRGPAKGHSGAPKGARIPSGSGSLDAQTTGGCSVSSDAEMGGSGGELEEVEHFFTVELCTSLHHAHALGKEHLAEILQELGTTLEDVEKWRQVLAKPRKGVGDWRAYVRSRALRFRTPAEAFPDEAEAEFRRIFGDVD